MHYTLNQLVIFQKICETGSITKAAELLHLTQPAVSIQLRNFQDQFETPLTEVVGRKLFITDFGREIEKSALKILEQVHAINYKSLAYKGQLTGRLKISIVSTGKYIMPYYLADFIRKHPGVELQVDVTNKQQVIRSLEENSVDFSLVSIAPPNIKLNRIDLLDNALYLVGSKTLLPRKDETLREMFSNYPVIFRETGSGTRQVMEQFIRKHKLQVSKKIELTSNEAVKQAIIAGIGISIVPSIGIRNELKSGVMKIIPVKGLPMKTRWQIVWPQGKELSPVTEKLFDYIRENNSSISAKLLGAKTKKS